MLSNQSQQIREGKTEREGEREIQVGSVYSLNGLKKLV